MKLSRSKLMSLSSPSGPDLGELNSQQRLWLLQMSGMVKRYHNIPTIIQDTVGEHTYGVLWLIVVLSEPQLPSSNLFFAALVHDTPEVNWGDITGPTKRLLNLRQAFTKLEDESFRALGVKHPLPLTEEEQNILRLADCMDGMLHCCYERALGNQAVCEVINKFHEYIDEKQLTPTQQRVLDDILDIWRIFDEHHR